MPQVGTESDGGVGRLEIFWQGFTLAQRGTRKTGD